MEIMRNKSKANLNKSSSMSKSLSSSGEFKLKNSSICKNAIYGINKRKEENKKNEWESENKEKADTIKKKINNYSLVNRNVVNIILIR